MHHDTVGKITDVYHQSLSTMSMFYGLIIFLDRLALLSSNKSEASRFRVVVLFMLQEIIQKLIDNSSTFRDKTEYAQDKYIKKKKKK